MAKYAIGDIHGCSQTFRKLVEDELKLTKEDTLYLLGDLVNKGPDSKGVIDFVMQLGKEGYKVVPIRGNHDQMFLDAYYGRISDYWTSEHAEPKTLKSFDVSDIADVPVKYLDFLKDMPYCIEEENCFLVHAGFNFTIEDPFADFNAMLKVRKFQVKPEKLGGKLLIHGHVPVYLNLIEDNLKSSPQEVNLDAGCVYYLNEGLGYLVAMNIDTLELLKQKNIDQPYFIDVKK